MHIPPGNGQDPRRVFIVFSSKAMPYAEKCIESLLQNALERIDLTLITDELNDKDTITQSVRNIPNPNAHKWNIFDDSEATAIAEVAFADFNNLRAFRRGHPCWRKLTDPLLFTQPEEEMIILDPDLYFPNQFIFEPTPEKQLLLMWQPPSCLLPPESVIAAFRAPARLAHHVDIGVAQWRKDTDLEWLDWFIGKLGGESIPRIMHVEAIVWSALAMKLGGGYLNPISWHCWHRSHWKRLLIKLGLPGLRVIQMEDFRKVKCFHACGMSKWWLKAACEANLLTSNNRLDKLLPPMPFAEFTKERYQCEKILKEFLWKIGYYKLINPD